MNTNLSVGDLRKIAAAMQNKRLLALLFPRGDAPYHILLVNRFEGEEHLSRDFRFVLEILSDNAKLDPKDFIDKQITVQLLRDDGSFRYFNGYIFSFRHVRTDGGIAFYEAEMGPWLRYLTLRKNNRLFLDDPIRSQTAAIFQDYGVLPVWDWKVGEKDPVIPMACQFDEHDHNYVHRRWEYRGWGYRYEHTSTEHKLIVSDPTRNAPAIDGESPEMPYQSLAGSLEADGIKLWSLVQQSTSTHIGEARTDFKHFGLNARSGGFVDSRTDAWKDSGKQKLELYRYAGSFGHQNTEDGQKLTDVQIEAIEAIARQWEATGNNRFVMPGRWFQMVNHFGRSISDNQFDDQYLITSAYHKATNNYLQGAGAEATYSNRFTCVHRRTPWRPMRGYNSVDTRILAPQTAMVVGPEGQSLYTDEYGRVLLQFQWDREGRYTTWVRVSSGWAGGNQGMTALPRIGSEVVVMWLEGNPDHPIITGRLHGQDNMSAWQLPHQRALTGIRSRELIGDQGNQDGGRSNHLVFDDTANAIQTQLRSDHGASQLSLGSITRIEDWQGRQDARGEGFELRTDAVGAIRSGKGMLVSTEARRQGTSHISDVSEPASRLAQAQEQHSQLGKLAQQHRAQDSEGDQSGVADALRAQVDSIRGRTTRGGDGSFPELNTPHLLLAGASGLQATTPATVHVSGGEHIALTAVHNVSVTAGKSLFASMAEKISLFVQNAGMKLFAAKGKVEIQAHSDNIELTAQKTVKVLSTMENIEIASAKEILLTSGGAYIRISNGNIEIHAPGKIDLKGSQYAFNGPTRTSYSLPDLPQAGPLTFSQKLRFRTMEDGTSTSQVRYAMFTPTQNGKAAERVLGGVSSIDGSERRLNPQESEDLIALYGQGEWGTSYDLNIDRDDIANISSPEANNTSGVSQS